MTGDKHCGGSVQTLNWIHTTSISMAALFSCSLRRQYPSHIYGHGWTKATATVMISSTAIVMTSWLLYCWSDTTLPSFLSSLGTFVADPTQKIQIGWRDQCATSKAISETLHERSTTVPGRLTSVKYSNPSRTIWLSIVLSDHRHKPLEQTLGTFHSLCIVEWRDNGVIGRAVGELLLAFWLCILTSFNCIMVIHTAPPRLCSHSPTQRQHQKKYQKKK